MLDLKKTLKIDEISQYFEDALKESYPLYQNNCKMHRENAAIRK